MKFTEERVIRMKNRKRVYKFMCKQSMEAKLIDSTVKKKLLAQKVMPAVFTEMKW